MRRPNIGLLACALLALALGLAGTARAACGLQMYELPVKMVGTRPIATVGINGQQVPLLVDTGAYFSMLTHAAADQLKLPLDRLPFGFELDGIAGEIRDLRLATVDHLQLLHGNLPNMQFVVGGNEIGDTAMGILGRNILARVDTEYDLAHGVIRFVFPTTDCGDANMAYWANDVVVSEVPLLRERRTELYPAMYASVKLNGHSLKALFDTGATTLVSLYGAHAAGLEESSMKRDGVTWGAGQGSIPLWLANFDSVALGDETVLHNKLPVADFPPRDMDMLLGIDFFLSHRIYVSARRQRMFFTYNGGPVFARNHEDAAAPAQASASSEPDTLSAGEHARRGAASLSRHDLPAALADLDRACALQPGNAEYLLTRAEIHADLRQGQAAWADLDAALRLQPTLPRALLMRAWWHGGGGERDKAAAATDLATLDNALPPQAQERLDMAMQYHRLALPEAELRQWTLWLDAHPSDFDRVHALAERCLVRVRLARELELAATDCNAAIDLDAQNADALDARGWLRLRLAQPDKARADFDKAIGLRKSPDASALSLYGRGDARQRQGDVAGASADFAAARRASPAIDARIKAEGLPLAPDAGPAIRKASASAPAS